MLDQKVKSQDEVIKLYTEYAYRIGFGIRLSNMKYKGRTIVIEQREMYYSKQGIKRNPQKKGKRSFVLKPKHWK